MKPTSGLATSRGRVLRAAVQPVLESLERRCLFAGDIPTGYQLLETLTIDGNTSPTTSTHTLGSGVPYYLRASGTALNRYDAEYRYTDNPPKDVVTRTFPPASVDVGLHRSSGFGQQGPEPDWGDYQSDHVYVTSVVGTNEPLALMLRAAPGDTFSLPHDAFTVEIYSKAPAQTPVSGGGLGANGGQRGDENTSPDTDVRYFDGTSSVSTSDLFSGGFGTPWGHTRTWTNSIGYQPEDRSRNGNGWIVSQTPYMVQVDGNDTVAVITGGTNAHYFDLVSGSYVPRHFDTSTLSLASNVFTFRDSTGNTITFDDFANATANKRGQFKQLTDAGGNATSVTSYTGDGKIAEVQRSQGSGGSTIIESYQYGYVSGGTNDGLISSITLRRSTNNGGSWSTVRSVDYAYYDGTTSNGNARDLKTATIKDGSGSTIDTNYYRYYTSNSATGYAGGLKYVFNAESYARLAAAYTPDSATDAQADDYADDYYEYGSGNRITKVVRQGKGGSDNGDGGLGTFTYAYTESNNTFGYNSWEYKTVETLPDGTTNTVYSNVYGQPMLKVYKPSGGADEWKTFYKYDSDGRLVLKANPSAVSGYDENEADLLELVSGNYTYLRDGEGLIETIGYYSSTTATSSSAGGVDGYQQNWGIRRGETGTNVPQGEYTYIERSGGATIYPLASSTKYRNTNGTGGQTTSYTYTWFTGTALKESQTTTLPTVTTGQNGPNSAAVQTTFYDTYGRPIWAKDADGHIAYNQIDNTTGAVVKQIVDVDTDNTADFSGLPSGWASPNGLHLITLSTVDALGRTTKLTDPNGSIDYTVYKDASHEVRLYPAWNNTADAPTGPTQVVREDRANGYIETLTMSATPSLNGSDEPTSGESIGSVQTLTRDYYSIGGQKSHTDRYFNLSGVTYSTSTSLGTSGTNFHRTEFGYDVRGRLDRTELPTGTITRTVYDKLSRPASSWAGLDDTPSSGQWSPTNTTGTDLVKVTENQYDGGGVGDSNLTKQTQDPGAADDRVTEVYYDWRNRLVAIKNGVQVSEGTDVQRQIEYRSYDNLDQVTAVETFDGDNVTVTSTSGVPNAPSSSLRRAKTTYDYDELGRVYRTSVFSVDPSSGNVSSDSLDTDTWYDKRGNVIKIAAPGGLVSKNSYDGAGRLITIYATDGGGDSGFSDADDVTGDKVLEQTTSAYDDNGNVILVETKQRFHDETLTGSLGDDSTGPKARVSYQAFYYDDADRLTDAVDVGTNAGSAYSRPGSVPSRSGTVHLTSYGYDDAGLVSSVIDPRGIEDRTYYDAAGRVTKTIEAYVNGTPSSNDDRTTEYTYDGSDHVLTMKAVLPGSAYQETQWVYAARTSSGSDLNSNDLLSAVKYPDKSTGAASSGEQEDYTANALGQNTSYTDRNGNEHEYSYDVLGRMLFDEVTTLGSGVDGSVRKLGFTYNTQGLVEKLTSYNSSGGVVNQVQREYNGLGQLTKEYQEHAGAVNTSISEKVQYTYSEMPGGANHSRLTKVTHPNGRIVRYEYASGLDGDISRVSFLAYDASGSVGTHLEEYSYLGLSTVVEKVRPEPGTELTYLDTVSGDAGDQYAGLDRFGRIIDQRWIDSSSGTAIDRFKYGYDRNGNVLFKDNQLDNNFDELYHADGASSGYDLLDRLVEFQRGALSDANSDGTPDTVTTASRSQSWSLDALGNWSSVSNDGTPEARTHNRQNQATAVGIETPEYDANGNTTLSHEFHNLAYDAWNQLVNVVPDSPDTISYGYDALGRRVWRFFEDGNTFATTTVDYYFSDRWQVLEEQQSGDTTSQYVWSPHYVDEMVLRDRDTDADGDPDDERLYVQQDHNYNVTSLTDDAGAVVERFAYDPYGSATVLEEDWDPKAGNASGYAWKHLHQGGMYDNVAGLYHFRHRDLSPTLGRWMQQDFGYFDSSNLYQAFNSNTRSYVDPLGLWRVVVGPGETDRIKLPTDQGGTITVTVTGGGPVRIIWQPPIPKPPKDPPPTTQPGPDGGLPIPDPPKRPSKPPGREKDVWEPGESRPIEVEPGTEINVVDLRPKDTARNRFERKAVKNTEDTAVDFELGNGGKSPSTKPSTQPTNK